MELPQINQTHLEKSLPINLYINHRSDKITLELRTETGDRQKIKNILLAAIDNTEIIVYPQFSDRLRATNSLIQAKIINLNKETGKYEFLI